MSTEVLRDSPMLGDVIAHNVRALRREQGLSQQALADAVSALGVAMKRPAVAKIEDGDPTRRRPVSVEELVALAVALDVSPARLFLPMIEDVRGGVQLTPTVRTTPQDAWLWIAEQAPWWEDVNRPQPERYRAWDRRRAGVVGEIPAVTDATGRGSEAAERRQLVQRLGRIEATVSRLADADARLSRAEELLDRERERLALEARRIGSSGPRQRGRDGSKS